MKQKCDYHHPKIIKTPRHNIPIGEAIIQQDGSYALRIKKAHGRDIEQISLDKLLSLIITNAE